MNWTEEKSPKEGESYYNHCDLETPLGKFRIEWKGYKENPSYDVQLEGNYILTEYDLNSAKEEVKKYLEDKQEQLNKFLLKQ